MHNMRDGRKLPQEFLSAEVAHLLENLSIALQMLVYKSQLTQPSLLIWVN